MDTDFLIVPISQGGGRVQRAANVSVASAAIELSAAKLSPRRLKLLQREREGERGRDREGGRWNAAAVARASLSFSSLSLSLSLSLSFRPTDRPRFSSTDDVKSPDGSARHAAATVTAAAFPKLPEKLAQSLEILPKQKESYV